MRKKKYIYIYYEKKIYILQRHERVFVFIFYIIFLIKFIIW